VAAAAALSLWLTDAVAGDENWLLLADLGSPVGFTTALGTALGMRARVELVPRRTGRDTLDALRYTRPAYVLVDAATLGRLVAEPGLEQADLSAIRAILVAEPLASGVARAFEEATGTRLCLGYAPPGLAGLAVCNPINGRRVGGSLGIPLPGVEARVVGPDGRPTGAGEAGALELRAPFGPDDWLRPGLTARQDGAGYLHACETGRGDVPARPGRP
jgi:long-chain acyl-CoA synthetase